ncbi:FtsW/RodA/SpoVE family cell cycle protein [Anaeromicropila populeti]|uniref:Rod shape determining protein RodA n=1 Tax=Anaeromicropila populeti TaxID=37658 RepID=A0A1I6L801_9FIRM|nr:FtsW/RodA/SpoVE family cell cycle protein [Anaeromicropila populeti]SFR99615.1 rod shape determining protein RodA [Anaeromicropila populeti]
MFQFKQYDWKRLNISLLMVVITLSIISAYIVRFAADEQFKGSYFKGQIIGLVFGLFIITVVALIDYHFICKFVILYYIVGTMMVAATKFSPLGTDLGTDSYRWIRIGFNFQPSEVCKIILILTLAVFFEKFNQQMDKFRVIVLSTLIMIIPTAFVLVQSDLSSSMVMVFIFAMMLFAAGISYKLLLPIIAVGIPVIVGLFWYVQQPWQKLLHSYQYDRIFGFMNPEKYAQSIMYQQNHSVQAIGSGGLFGKILVDNNSGVRNYIWVDVRESDFIFTVIGEELGFIGSCIIILLLATIIIKCLLIAKKSRDYQGMMIAVGIASMFMFQVFANIGVATRILPNTGLPLPFLSRGLSSTLSSMIGIGMIINIGLQSGKGSRNGFSMSNL